MAQDVIINGVAYNGVNSVSMRNTRGETVEFVEDTGQVHLPELDNPADNDDVAYGKEFVNEDGTRGVGSFTLDAELGTQRELLNSSQATVDSNAQLLQQLRNALDSATTTAVQFVDQALSEAQQLQARKNIGALGFDYLAPDYVQAEADRVTLAVQSKLGTRSLVFLALSDLHNNTADTQVMASVKHAGQAARLIADTIGLDFAAVLGDVTIGDSTTTLDGGRADIMTANRLLADALRGVKQFRTPGNHDPLTYSYTLNGSYLGAGELYALFGSHNSSAVHPDVDAVRGYCYQDFTAQKVRVICLNTADGQGMEVTSNVGVERVSGQQLQWFAETLDLSSKPDAAEWGIVILSHHPLDWGQVMPAANCLQAYLTGATYAVTHEGVAVRYAFAGKNVANVIAQFHGHVHGFRVDYIHHTLSGAATPTTVQRIAIPNACFNRNNEYGENGGADWYGIEFGETVTYHKTANTARDTAFCVVAIDLTERKIYAMHYGAGYDRIVPYAGASLGAHTIVNRLTNATTSNQAASVTEGASYTATITANSGYTLDSVTVTMGSVDVSSSVVVGNNIHIPAVTGPVVVTAVASVPVAAYTNLVPIALDPNGAGVYNNTGYKNGYYASSSSPYEGADAQCVLTGLMPYANEYGHIPADIYIKGAVFSATESHCRLQLWSESKGYVGQARFDVTDYFTIQQLGDRYYKLVPTRDSQGTSGQIAQQWGETAYIRVSLVGTGEGLIITAGEPIES